MGEVVDGRSGGGIGFGRADKQAKLLEPKITRALSGSVEVNLLWSGADHEQRRVGRVDMCSAVHAPSHRMTALTPVEDGPGREEQASDARASRRKASRQRQRRGQCAAVEWAGEGTCRCETRRFVGTASISAIA